jgi:hypothetical protein
MADETRRYLAIFVLSDANPTRLANIMPNLLRYLENAADGKPELAFRSANRDEFGYFLRSKLAANQILARVQSPEGDAIGLRRPEEPIFDNSDQILIVELGADFSSFGRSRAGTWLQRH